MAANRKAVLAAVAAFAVTALWRLMTYSGFPNDHYVHLARAQQMLLGAWPVRDFVDPGLPLMYAVSALARWVFGVALRSEFMVVAAGFAVGAAATAVCALSLTPSITVSAVVVLLQVLASPRSYSYPKILLYGLAACAVVAVAAAPVRRRIMLAGALAAVAFLFRHDHGLYIGVPCAVAVVLSRLPDWRAAFRGVCLFAATAGLLLAPWAVFVQRYEGLAGYFRSGLYFSAREADATVLREFPRFLLSGPLYSAENAQAWLSYLFVGVPIGCAVLAAWCYARGRQRWIGESAAITSLALMALLADRGFLRSPLGMRLPDAVVLPGLLGAWMLGLAWTGRASGGTFGGTLSRIATATVRTGIVRTAVVRSICVAVVLVTSAAIWRVGDTTQMLDRAGFLDGTDAIVSNLDETLLDLSKTESKVVQVPSRVTAVLAPFFDYIDSCTQPTDRILITAQYPDVFVAAKRGFAGGQVAFIEGYYVSREEQLQTLTRMRAESVPFVFLVLDRQPVFERDFPLINEYVASAYTPMFDFPVPGLREGLRVLVERKRTASGTYAETNWPCFR